MIALLHFSASHLSCHYSICSCVHFGHFAHEPVAERAGKVTIKMTIQIHVITVNAACLSHILQSGAESESLP